MRKDEVTWREAFAQLLNRLQKRFVIGDKDLDVIANSRQFPKRADKIWNGLRRAIPYEN